MRLVTPALPTPLIKAGQVALGITPLPEVSASSRVASREAVARLAKQQELENAGLHLARFQVGTHPPYAYASTQPKSVYVDGVLVNLGHAIVGMPAKLRLTSFSLQFCSPVLNLTPAQLFQLHGPDWSAIYVNKEHPQMARLPMMAQIASAAYQYVRLPDELISAENLTSPEIPTSLDPQKVTELHDILNKNVATLELGWRTSCSLSNANFQFIGHLVRMTDSEILSTRCFNLKSINELRKLLAKIINPITDQPLRLGMTAEELHGWAEPK